MSSRNAALLRGSQAKEPIALGVLLVHGVGRQVRGETLTAWVDEIVKVIESGTEGAASVEVERADLASTTGNDQTPAHAFVRIQYEQETETWLFTEALWADAFPEPSFRKLVNWSFRAIPWTMIIHFVQSNHRRSAGTTGIRRHAFRLRAMVEVSLAMFLSPLFALLVFALFLVGLVPVDWIRNIVVAIQRTLAGTAGDSMVLLQSPVRAAAIHSRFWAAFSWLRSRVRESSGRRPDAIAVVAHSQGAAITYDALGGVGEQSTNGEGVESEAAWPALRLDYVTFGAGINKLAALRELERRRERSGGANQEGFLDLGRLQWLHWFVVLNAGWLWWLVTAGQLDARSLLIVPVAGLAGLLVIATMFSARWLAKRLPRRTSAPVAPPRIGSRADMPAWVVIAMMVTYVSLMVGVIKLLMQDGFPPFPLFALTLVLPVIALSGARILAQPYHDRLLRLMREPKGVAQWADFYASKDPVPNGRTMIPSMNGSKSQEVWNLGSLLWDHTAYWANRDGFVLPLVERLAAAAGSNWRTELPNLDRIDVRSCLRVRLRKRIQRLFLASALLVVAAYWGELTNLWVRLGANLIDEPIRFRSLWNTWALQGVVLCTVGLLVGRLVFAIPDFFWRLWVQGEQATLIGHGRTSGSRRLGVFAFVTLLVVAAAGYVTTLEGRLSSSGVSYGLIGFLVVILLIAAQIYLASSKSPVTAEGARARQARLQS